MTDIAALLGELEALTARVRRLERRLNDLEPETLAGVGREAPDYSSDVPALDALGEAFGALGFFSKNEEDD